MSGAYGGPISLDSYPGGSLRVQQSVDGHVPRGVLTHALNHAVEVVIPGVAVGGLPSAFTAAAPSIVVAKVSLDFLLQPAARALLASGSLLAISLGTPIDVAAAVCLLPGGLLVLSLDKVSYEKFGLPGTPSPFKHSQRHVVRVVLTDPAMCPGHKLFERTNACFARHACEYTFAFSWTPSTAASASILSSLLSILPGARVVPVMSVAHTRVRAVVPILTESEWDDFGRTSSDALFQRLHDVYEFLGFVACGIELGAAVPDGYASTAGVVEPLTVVPATSVCRWTGMLSADFVQMLLKELRGLLATRPDLFWAAVTVWGFRDAPVSWNTSDHGHLTCGDNSYTVVLFSGGKSWYFQSVDAHDKSH